MRCSGCFFDQSYLVIAGTVLWVNEYQTTRASKVFLVVQCLYQENMSNLIRCFLLIDKINYICRVKEYN